MFISGGAAFYEAVMANAVDAIVIADSKGIIVDVNRACYELFGYESDELISQSISLLMPLREAAEHDTHIRNYLKTGESRVIGKGREVVAVDKSGKRLRCHLSLSRVDTTEGIHFAGTLRNLEELKVAENKIRQLAMVAEHTDNAVVITNRRGLIEWVNAGFERMTGYSFDEVIGVNPGQLLQGRETDANEVNKIRTALQNDKRVDSTLLNYRKNGETYWTALTIEKIHDGMGGWQYISIQKDISERINYERLLAARLNRLNLGQACTHIGTWDWNLGTGDVFWTEQVGPIFGYPLGEMETSYENFLAAIHEDDRVRVVAAIDKAVEFGEGYDVEYRIVWPDGTIKWANSKGDVIKNEKGEAVQMIGIVQDIQRVKDAESELVEAKEAAEKASQAKSEFLSSISHELRTPLNSVLGFSQLLLSDGSLNEDQKESVSFIHDSGEHLLNLVNDVLELAKLDVVTKELIAQDVDVDLIIAQCLRLLSRQIEDKGVSVSIQCRTPHPMVRANELRLKQVLLNLLSNAVKYNRPGGTICISCELKSTDSLRMKVSDTGYGINAGRAEEVFTPFSRLGYENSSIEGVGIGLVITKGLVEAMNGKLGFNSKEGEGSEFWFDIGLSDAQKMKDTVVAGGAVESLPSLDRVVVGSCKILCIDDNGLNRLVLKKICRQAFDADFIEATTAQEGLRKAQKDSPDIILLDLHLPDEHGVDVCRELRRLYGMQLPIIAVTADFGSLPKTLSESIGFTEVEYKPIDMASLVAKIRQHL